MASLRKKSLSQYWFACFTLPDGKRVQRSTKETKRSAAQKKASEWEQLAKERTKARQAHKVIADIYRAAHQQDLPSATPRSFLSAWVKRRQKEVSEATFVAYESTIKRFLIWLDHRADNPMADLETSTVVAFRDAEALRVSHSTANKHVKILRIVFEDARRDGYIAENPAKDCSRLKTAVKTSTTGRRPFTVAELKLILKLADAEMRSLILFGLYTGQRLGDLARLTWGNLDLQANELHLTTAKTGRVVQVPFCGPLLKHINSIYKPHQLSTPVHPRAACSSQPANSNRFGDLLARAGLVAPRPHTKGEKGKGRTGRREASLISFHSLRYTATSLMKNAGVSPSIVQDIIGHESAEISTHYTHVESAAKRQALSVLPDLDQ